MARLNRSVLPGLAPHAQPLVRPGEAGAGILHFGISAFHRAHQAVYTEEAIAEGGGDWAIVEVAPSSHDVLGALRAQEMLYSVLTVDGTEATARVVGAFDSGLHARDEPGAVLRRIADPAIRVVTFTVTEKAYAPGSAVLDLLVRGLRLRETPLALVSCDNLNNNGERLRDLVGTALQDPDVMALLSFPGTMVDRIVPATTPQSLATVETLLGARDEAAVVGEPFRQWVVQDDFPGGRPAWSAPASCSPRTPPPTSCASSARSTACTPRWPTSARSPVSRPSTGPSPCPAPEARWSGSWRATSPRPSRRCRSSRTASRSWNASPTPPSATARCR